MSTQYEIRRAIEQLKRQRSDIEDAYAYGRSSLEEQMEFQTFAKMYGGRLSSPDIALHREEAARLLVWFKRCIGAEHNVRGLRRNDPGSVHKVARIITGIGHHDYIEDREYHIAREALELALDYWNEHKEDDMIPF